MVCLVETRANENQVECFRTKLPNSWDWAAILAGGYSGGILVAWSKSLRWVSPLAASRRALYLIISHNSSSN